MKPLVINALAMPAVPSGLNVKLSLLLSKNEYISFITTSEESPSVLRKTLLCSINGVCIGVKLNNDATLIKLSRISSCGNQVESLEKVEKSFELYYFF